MKKPPCLKYFWENLELVFLYEIRNLCENMPDFIEGYGFADLGGFSSQYKSFIRKLTLVEKI